MSALPNEHSFSAEPGRCGRTARTALLATALAWAWAPLPAAAGEDILNARSFWRVRMAWKTPVLCGESGTVCRLLERPRRGLKDADRKPVKIVQSPPPPAGWKERTFDDGEWARSNLPLAPRAYPGRSEYVPGNPAEWSLICARGKFEVNSPSAAGLTVTVAYRGGAAVYVNGREVARAHLPAVTSGTPAGEALAEMYPKAAYVADDGFLLKDASKHPDNFAKRTRRLSKPIPSKLLRKGVNVLAVEVHRAPLSKVYLTHEERKRHYRGKLGPWAHCGLEDVQLTAPDGAGGAVVPNVRRPQGIQVWTARAADQVILQHWSDPNEPAAIRLSGARGGWFSGRIVLSASEPIRSAKATPGELKAAGDSGGVIPASAVQVRYAARATEETGFMGEWGGDGLNRFDLLLPDPPAEVPVMEIYRPRRAKGPKLPPAAMLPVWITVHVPGGAEPGIYHGQVAVRADGLDTTRVPLTVKVYDWLLPDPAHYHSANLIWQSHETTAYYYKVPLWSDRHFELMGRVLALTRSMANRFCSVHLIVGHYHQGNRQSMVRWIRKPGGGYDYDFSIFERYLDLYGRVLGKPHCLFLSVFVKASDLDAKKRGTLRTTGENPIKVSCVDPSTGQVRPMSQPLYGTQASVAFWKPVLAEARRRLAKRGWLDVTCIGAGGDTPPRPETIAVFRRIWPDCKWMNSSHTNPSRLRADPDDRSVYVPVPWRESVWGRGRQYDPDNDPRGRGYPKCHLDTHKGGVWPFPRVGQSLCHALHESSRLILQRCIPEATLQGDVAGVGRIGADYWPIPGNRGKYGRLEALSGNAGMHLSVGASTRYYVGPGPQGPVPTERLRVFHEGVQVREALVFCRQAVLEGKVDGDLAKRIMDLLHWRARHYLRTLPDERFHWVAFEGSGWRRRDDRLFALCAAAGKAMEEKTQ